MSFEFRIIYVYIISTHSYGKRTGQGTVEGIAFNQCSRFLMPEGLKIWHMKKTRVEDVTSNTCIYNGEMQICTAKDKSRPNIWN